MTNRFIICDDDVRIDRYIRQNIFSDIPQSLLEKHLRKKVITLDGQKVLSNTRVKNGQILLIKNDVSFTSKAQHFKKKIKEQLFKYNILYQDEYIIALDKPQGIAVQGGHKIDASINDILEGFERINNEIPKIVHRLDKDTSGVLLLARTLKVARFLADSFANHKIKKTYRALAIGTLPTPSGKIDISLAKKCHNGQEMTLPDKQGGKISTTYFKLLRAIPEKSLSYVELQPTTGRKHQLRAHMKHLGNPIYGDRKYGEARSGKLALHAYSVSLELPNGKVIDVKAEIPDHIEKVAYGGNYAGTIYN